MATYSTNLALTLMATGEQSNTWGDTTNTNLGTLLEQAISGYVTQAITDGSSANTTITIPNGATGVARNMFIEMTGALTFSTTSLIVPANKKMYFIFNNTSGGFAVTVKVSGQTGILVPNGKKVVLTCNGTDIVEAHTAIVGNATMGGTLGVTGTTTAAAINASGLVAMAGAATVGTTLGVTGATTLSSTLGVTGVATLGNGAILGTPASGTVTNLTGTASININGTVGATTPAAGAFTTLSATGLTTLGSVSSGIALAVTSSAATYTGSFINSSATSAGLLIKAGSTSGHEVLDVQTYNATSLFKVVASGATTVTGTLSATLDATIYGVTVGRGAGAVSTNTAVGASALAANTTGSSETAFGKAALKANTTGTENTAVGADCLQANTTGSSNSVLGLFSMYSNTTGSSNTAIGRSALENNTTASNNTAVGYQAGYTNVTGTGNTYIGYIAGKGRTGNYNTAVGNNSLTATGAGAQNTAIGYDSMQGTTSGASNTGVGFQPLYQNITGNYNTAVGDTALFNNTTASNNTAVGYQAGYSNTTGDHLTAVGHTAGYSCTGNDNTFYGWQAGYGVTSGTNNICIGSNAGNYTTALTTGAQSIYLGTYSTASSSSVTYEMVIGYGTTGKGANTGFINMNSGGVYQGNNLTTWSTTSDQRLKKNIVENNTGLDIINQIQVRNFEYRLPEEVDAALKPSDAIQKEGVQLGVIAQELQAVLPDCVKTESTGVMSVNSDALMWHMINAIKELSAKVTALEAK